MTACQARQKGHGEGTEVMVVEASAVLAGAEDRVVEEAVAALVQRDQAQHCSSGSEDIHNMRQLLGLVLRCVRAGRAEPIITPSEQIAAHRFAAGIDLAEAQKYSMSWRRRSSHVVGAHRRTAG
jgi:hypothetical protein